MVIASEFARQNLKKYSIKQMMNPQKAILSIIA